MAMANERECLVCFVKELPDLLPSVLDAALVNALAMGTMLGMAPLHARPELTLRVLCQHHALMHAATLIERSGEITAPVGNAEIAVCGCFYETRNGKRLFFARNPSCEEHRT